MAALCSSVASAPLGRIASCVRAKGGLTVCRIEVFEPWVAALDGIGEFERLEVLYWLHEARRDLVRQSPRNDGQSRGTFSLRTPVRPNPIGTKIVKLVSIEHRPQIVILYYNHCIG